MKKYLSFISNNKLILLNLLVFIVLYSVIFAYNQCSPILRHDSSYFNMYSFNDILSFKNSRFIPYSLGKLYCETIPAFLNIHPADFKVNYFVCAAVSLLYMLFPILISKNFYFWKQDFKSFFSHKESAFLLILSFVCVSSYMFGNQHPFQQIFLGIEEILVFLEYIGSYFLYFLLFSFLFKIIIKDCKISTSKKIIYPVIALIIGLWTEFINIGSFITFLLILLLLLIFNREKLKNKLIWTMFFAMFTGIFVFFFLSQNYSLSHFGSLGDYSIFANSALNLDKFIIFVKEFIKLYFRDFIILWIILIPLFFILKNKVPEKHKKNVNLFLYLNWALIIGFLLCGFSTFVVDKELRGVYIFDLYYFPYIGYCIFLFVLFNSIGAFYYFTDKKFKNVILTLFVFFSVLLYFRFIPWYKEMIKAAYLWKLELYKYEKYYTVYSAFNEYFMTDKNNFNLFYMNSFLKENNEFDEKVLCEKLYNHKIKGFIYMNDGIATEFTEQRENILGEIEDKYNIFHIIQFTPLKKYDDFNFTFAGIDEIEKNIGKNDLLDKMRASLYSEAGNYQKALKIYETYIKKQPEDFDAQIKTAILYKQTKQFQKALLIYNSFLKQFPDNIFVLLDISGIYYSQQKYKKALNINSRILDLLLEEKEKYNDLIPVIYLNNAIIYKKLNLLQKAQENFAKINQNFDLYWINIILHHVLFDYNFFLSEDIPYSDTDLFNIYCFVN